MSRSWRRSWICSVATLAELNGEEDEALVYLEEFVMISTRRTAIVLGPSARTSWEAAGRRLWVHSDRSLSVELWSQVGSKMVFSSLYGPTGATRAELDAWHDLCVHTSEIMGTADAVHLCGGDFNAHRGDDWQYDGIHTWPYALQTPTTRTGKEWQNAVADSKLCHADSFHWLRRRGTWYHNVAKRWYELDGLLTTTAFASMVQTMTAVQAPAISDHIGREYVLHIADRGARQRRHLRAEKFARINQAKATQEEERVCTQLFRGRSAEAVMRREVLGLWVDKVLRTEAEEAQMRRGDEEEAAGRRDGDDHAESVEGLRRGEGRARRRRDEVLRGLLHGDGGGGDMEVRRGGGLPMRALRGDGGGGSNEESRRGEGSARNLLCDGSGGDMEGPRREEAQQRLLRGDGSGGDVERVWRGQAESGGPRRSVGNTGAEGLRRGEEQRKRLRVKTPPGLQDTAEDHRRRDPADADPARAAAAEAQAAEAAPSGDEGQQRCPQWARLRRALLDAAERVVVRAKPRDRLGAPYSESDARRIASLRAATEETWRELQERRRREGEAAARRAHTAAKRAWERCKRRARSRYVREVARC